MVGTGVWVGGEIWVNSKIMSEGSNTKGADIEIVVGKNSEPALADTGLENIIINENDEIKITIVVIDLPALPWLLLTDYLAQYKIGRDSHHSMCDKFLRIEHIGSDPGE